MLKKKKFLKKSKVKYINADKSSDKQTRLKNLRSKAPFMQGCSETFMEEWTMSLFLNEKLQSGANIYEGDLESNNPDIERLDQYLALIESNRKSSQFVPDDAFLALDMAGHSISRLNNNNLNQPPSISRLALALVQPCAKAPVQ